MGAARTKTNASSHLDQNLPPPQRYIGTQNKVLGVQKLWVVTFTRNFIIITASQAIVARGGGQESKSVIAGATSMSMGMCISMSMVISMCSC